MSRRTVTLRGAIATVVFAALAVFSLSLVAPLAAIAKAPKSRKAIVRAETVRLRSSPGKKGKLSGLLDSGRVARVLGKKKGWVRLKLASGTTGWVRADLLAINKKQTKDTGAFAAQHPVAPSRRVRRARHSEVSVAKVTRHKKSPTRVATRKAKVAAHMPVMKPLAVTHPTPKRRATPTAVVKPVQVARVITRLAPRIQTISRQIATPDTQVEAKITEGYETATLREGVDSQMLADLPADAPRVVTGELKASVPPLVTDAPAVEVSVAPETITASVPIPRSRAIKGGVAKAVRVPIERASKRGDRIVNRALSYRGVPYRMGATGHGAFDCSSFTRHVLSQSGESMPRTAAEQYRKGMPVTKEEMRAGDLVFFKNTYKHGVSHVGIYMGDGKFIHASSHGGVKTSSLSESYFVHHWAGARRPNITLGGD